MGFEVVLMDCWSKDVFIKNIIDKNKSDIMSNISFSSQEERDEWAIGIITFNLTNGYMSFEGDTKEELVYDIINKDIDNEINELNIGKECKDLLFKFI